MKLATTGHNAVTSGDFKSYQFGIRSADMGIILEVLRSKIYQNPIAAISREITSNARDANREVGKKSAPITIKFDKSLFNPGEITLTISDDGPGISVERISEIFINYGASTKRENNKQTGGFGLGGKTPFSYADSFSIITRVDGVKYTYVAAVDKSNTGKIFSVNEEPTEEGNGTSIVIPIKEQDVRYFEQNLFKATCFWDVLPRFIGFGAGLPTFEKHSYLDSIIVSHEGSSIYNYFGESSLYLLIDGIPYPVLNQDYLQRTNTGTIFLPFKTGELTIAANRESVQYDEATSAKIKKRYMKILDTFRDEVQEAFSKCTTGLEAAICLGQMKFKSPASVLFNILISDSSFKFKHKGQNVHTKLYLEHVSMTQVGSAGERRGCGNVILPEMNTLPVYALDMEHRTPGRDKTIMNASGGGFFLIEYRNRRLYQFKKLPFGNKRHMSEGLRKALDELDGLKKFGFKINRYSEVKSAKTPRKKMDVPDSFSTRYLRSDRRAPRIRMEFKSLGEKWACCYLLENKVTNNDFAWADILNGSSRILAIHPSNEKFVKNRIPTIEEWKKTLNKKKMSELLEIEYASKFVRTEKINIYHGWRSLTFPEVPSADIEYFIKRVHDHLRFLPSDFSKYYSMDNKIVGITEKIKNLFKKYPLINLLQHNTSSESIKNLNRYIELVNKEETSKKGE